MMEGKNAAILSPQFFAFFHRSIGSEFVPGNWFLNGNVNIFDVKIINEKLEILTRETEIFFLFVRKHKYSEI